MQAAGQAHLMPPCWPNLGSYLAWLQEHAGEQQRLRGHATTQPSAPAGATQQPEPLTQPNSTSDSPSTALDVEVDSVLRSEDQQAVASSSSSSDGRLLNSVFVKHRRGVKGQAVYVAHTEGDLRFLQERLRASVADFVVQQEVAPPMLFDGRKFVLRVHVLVVLHSRVAADAASTSKDPTAPDRASSARLQQAGVLPSAAGCTVQAPPNVAVTLQAPALASVDGYDVYVHHDVIVLPHACAYEAGSILPAVHISSKGSAHPAPFLLQQQLPELHATVWPQLQQLSVATVQAAAHVLIPAAVDPDAMLYHLFGFDCMVDAWGRLVLLEVNSYPAIASGTMSGVDTRVYTRLLGDMVTLLVLPLTDGVEPAAGGFVQCPT